MPLMVNGVPVGDIDSPSSHRDHGNCLLSSVTVHKANAIFGGTTLNNVDLGTVAPDYSSTMIIQHQHHSASSKMCKFQGCQKGTRGASGLCISHGGGRRYQKAGFHKGDEGRTVYYKAHGGGRRCQFLGCTKSAEGRTDSCIAHGGGRRCTHEGCARAAIGKRCLWGKPGTEFAVPDASQYDRFARGKPGICSAHSALVQDKCVHGGGTLLLTFFDPKPSGSGKMTVEDMNVDVLKMQMVGVHESLIPIRFGDPSSSLYSPPHVQFPMGSITLPESRVHGCALMAMTLFGKIISPSSEAGTSSYVAPPYNNM
ncbi:hypothetical protein MKW92_018253 [Papaver armeniacum]|nr:hypothetical protein MKW92_018253 [Papaver armeniacum]